MEIRIDYEDYVDRFDILSNPTDSNIQRCLKEYICNYENTSVEILPLVYGFLTEEDCAVVDLNLIVYYLQLTVHLLERKFERSFYRLDESDDEENEDIAREKLAEISLQLMAVVLSHYISGLPYKKHILNGQYLIDQIVKDCCHKRKTANALNSSMRILWISGITTIYKIRNSIGFHQETLFASFMNTFINLVYRLVRLYPKVITSRGLLQGACFDYHQNCLKRCGAKLMVELFLQHGVDPNCVDIHGQTIVGHILMNRSINSEQADSLLAVLMEGGAHMEAYKRSKDNTEMDKKLSKFFEQRSIPNVRMRRLACLAASSIRRYRLPASQLKVTASFRSYLSSFIELH